jgi:hypothetical protein
MLQWDLANIYHDTYEQFGVTFHILASVFYSTMSALFNFLPPDIYSQCVPLLPLVPFVLPTGSSRLAAYLPNIIVAPSGCSSSQHMPFPFPSCQSLPLLSLWVFVSSTGHGHFVLSPQGIQKLLSCHPLSGYPFLCNMARVLLGLALNGGVVVDCHVGPSS